ncbi:MAG: C40 family peptidase [Firmicutes bacterium]|nr:C40 family peptidase [[Eubacterium] siraeum]MCM1489131.1 C40 family peptidase [Bacillota bacterium]
MKKITALFLSAAILVMLCTACGNHTDDPADSQSESEQSLQSETRSDTEPEKTVSDITSIPVSTLFTEPLIQETTEAEPSPVDQYNQVVQTAESLLGIPFADNGSTPEEGFDNSGFIYYVLRKNGFINVPRQTQDQAVMGANIGYDELKSGDLAFFCTENSGNPDFGGIYIGDGQLIYSPMPGQSVKTADITSEYWRNSFVTGVSLS